MIFLSQALYCENDFTIYASTYERREWNLGTLFYGQDLEFSLNGNKEIFEISSPLQPSPDDQTNIDLSNTQFIDFHTLRNGVYESSIRGLLLRNDTTYQVRFPTISDVFYETEQPISFIRVIRNDVVLLAYGAKMWIAGKDLSLEFISPIIEIEVLNNFLFVVTTQNVQILYYDTQFQNTSTVIDSHLLNQLMPDYDRKYQIIDVQYAQLNDLVLLDKEHGVIILEVQNISHLNLRYHHYYPSHEIYYKMEIAYFPQNYHIVVTLQYQTVFILSQTKFVAYRSTYDVNQTKVKLSVVGTTFDTAYYIVYNSTYLGIYPFQQTNRLLAKKFDEQVFFNFHHFLSTVYIVEKKNQQTYSISNGLLIMQPMQQPINDYQRLQIIATETSQCAITLTYIVYDYLDNSLYSKKNTSKQIFQFVSYPTYPQSSIFNEIGVSGSNIHAKIDLNDESISLRLGYIEEMKVTGINWPEDIIYVNLYSVEIYIYYIVQVKNLQATLYRCNGSVLAYQLKCESRHSFSPNKELDNESFQWLQGETIIFGYISKFRRTIELFELAKDKVQKLFTISTSLQDVDAAITSFSLTKLQVFVVQEQKKQIQVYSFRDSSIIYTITNFDTYPYDMSPRFVRMVESQNLLIIVNHESIIVGYYFHSFMLIKYLDFPNSRQIEVSLTSFTFFVALHYGYLQELREYSLRLNQVQLLKIIPLFHYILQIPIQMMPSLDLVAVRAYTPVLQETVLLLYQPDASLRESLLTHISLGYFLKESLNIGITTLYNSGLLVHASSKYGMKNSFIYKNIQAVITSKWDEKYIHQNQLTIYYDTIDSPEQIEFVQNVTFVNLMTNIVATQSNQTIYTNSRNIQIPNDWFKGWIINYKIDCEQCQDSILLTQKIHQISSINYQSQLQGQCQLNSDFTVLLTKNKLIFLDAQHYVKHPPFFFTLDQYLQLTNIWCKDVTIFLSGWTNNSLGFLQMIRYEDNQFRIVGNPLTVRLYYQFTQIEFLDDNNFLILDGAYQMGNTYYSTSTLWPYHYEYTSPNHVQYIYTKAVDSRKHPEFFVSSFIVFKIYNMYRVILSDQSQGLFIQDFHYADKTIKCISADEDIVRVSLKQAIQQLLGLKLDKEVLFTKIIKFGEPEYNYQIFRAILLTNSIAHLSLVLSFDDNVFEEVRIVELLQRYSDFYVMQDASIVDNYLALAYQYQTYTICVYKLGTSQKQQGSTLEPILLMGGVEFENSQHFFSLLSDENGQLLLQANSDYSTMNLFRVEEFASLTFLGENIQQQIFLSAQNKLTSASLVLNIEISKQAASGLYWILVGILFFVIFFLLILAIIVFLKSRKKQQKRKQNKKTLIT